MEKLTRDIVLSFALLFLTSVLLVRWPEHTVAADQVHTPAVSNAPAVPVSTWGDYLAQYWGDKWPAFESQLNERQVGALQRQIRPEDIVPWNAVSAVIRENLRDSLQRKRSSWATQFHSSSDYDPDSIHLNPGRKQIDAESRKRIQLILDRYALELTALTERSFDLTAEADDAIWEQGRIRVFPLIEFDVAEPTSGHFSLQRKWVKYPWTVEYTVDAAEWPELDRTVAEIAAIKARCDRELVELIASI